MTPAPLRSPEPAALLAEFNALGKEAQREMLRRAAAAAQARLDGVLALARRVS